MVYGTHFIWNGVDSRDYNLMLCSFGEDSEEELSTALGLEPITDKLNDKTIDYGAKYSENLVFSMTLIKNQSQKNNDYFSRSELREVLAWLTSSKELNWLTLYDGSDTTEYQYYCRFTNVSAKKLFGKTAAIILEVTCDSPYAYSDVKEICFDLNDEEFSIEYAKKKNGDELEYTLDELCLNGGVYYGDEIRNNDIYYHIESLYGFITNTAAIPLLDLEDSDGNGNAYDQSINGVPYGLEFNFIKGSTISITFYKDNLLQQNFTVAKNFISPNLNFCTDRFSFQIKDQNTYSEGMSGKEIRDYLKTIVVKPIKAIGSVLKTVRVSTDDNGFVYPLLSITNANATNEFITLENNSASGESCITVEVPAKQTLYIDTENQLIYTKDQNGGKLLQRDAILGSPNFFKLENGENNLKIQQKVKGITYRIQYREKYKGGVY